MRSVMGVLEQLYACAKLESRHRSIVQGESPADCRGRLPLCCSLPSLSLSESSCNTRRDGDCHTRDIW
jgi:hypothetical protein